MALRESPSHGSSGSYDVQEAERRNRGGAAQRVMVNPPADSGSRHPRWVRQELMSDRTQSGSTPGSDVFEPIKSSDKKTRFQMTPHPITGQHLILPPGRTRSHSRTTARSAQSGGDAPGTQTGAGERSPAATSEATQQRERGRRLCCAGLVLVGILLLVAVCVGMLASELNDDGGKFSSPVTPSDQQQLSTAASDPPPSDTTVLPPTASTFKPSSSIDPPGSAEDIASPDTQPRNGGDMNSGAEDRDRAEKTTATETPLAADLLTAAEANNDVTPEAGREDGTEATTETREPESAWEDHRPPGGWENGDTDIPLMASRPSWLTTSPLPANQSPARKPAAVQEPGQTPVANGDPAQETAANQSPAQEPVANQRSAQTHDAGTQSDPETASSAEAEIEMLSGRVRDDMTSPNERHEYVSTDNHQTWVNEYDLETANRQSDDASSANQKRRYTLSANTTAGPPAADADRTERDTGHRTNPAPSHDLDLDLGSGTDTGASLFSSPALVRVRDAGWEWFFDPEWLPKKLRKRERKSDSRTQLDQRASSCFGPRSMVCPGQEDLCAVRCNSVVECPDLADERDCACADRLSPSLHCDGYFDCPDESDEMSCDGCAVGEFSCSSHPHLGGGECVPRHQRCDGTEHCPNGRDEQACLHLSDDVTPLQVYPLVVSRGVLHRQVAGRWLPVCHTAQDMTRLASDVCEGIVGRFTIGVATAGSRAVPAGYDGPFAVLAGTFSVAASCQTGAAVYVRCPPPACGHSTRQLTSGRTVRRPRSHNSHLRQRQNFDAEDSEQFRDPALPVAAAVPSSSGSPAAEFADLTLDASELDLKRPPPPAPLPPLPSPMPDEVELVPAYHSRPGLYGGVYHRPEMRDHDGRIVGGSRSAPGRHPWLVAIYRDGVFSCGGSILTKRWVLSAAHCFERFERYRYEIHAGMLRRQSFAPYEQSRFATHIIIHQDYNSRIYANDLAIIRLSRPLVLTQWVTPVCLPAAAEELLAPGTRCTVVGWGQTRQDGPEVQDLMEVEIPVLSFCPEHYDNVTIEICAGPIKGGKDSCQGDSGGPLLCRAPDGLWKQYGIVSHGRGCALPNSPGVYTRVSFFLRWINKLTAVDTAGADRFPVQRCPTRLCRLRGGMCLTESQLCDGQVDCLDVEDERFCGPNGDEILPVNMPTTLSTTTPVPEPAGTFGPPSGGPSPGGQPPFNVSVCTADEFKCVSVSQCVPASQRCDMRPQCGDYSDEASCSLLDYLVHHQPDRVCDRHVDLPAAADEELCCPPDSGQFYCPYSQRSIPLKWCCDRQADCEYGEDEADCVALVEGSTDTIALDRAGRPLKRRTGIVAIKSDFASGASWTPICTESHNWIGRYSDVICNYLYQGGTATERHEPVSSALLRPQYPLGPALYDCGQDRGVIRSRRELKGAGLPAQAAHPMLELLSLLDTLQPNSRSSCTGVRLSCADPEPLCGHRPALKQLRDLPGPSAGRGVWPMYVTVYVNGVEVGGGTLISTSWVVVAPEVLTGISPSSDYVSVRAGQYRRQLFTTAAQQTARVDYRSRDGDVTLLHISRPLAVGEHVYPACLPADNRDVALQHCYAVGWDGVQVKGVKLLVKEVCPAGQICTMPSSTASCKTDAAWSGALLCQTDDRLWRAAAVFHEQGPRCFRRPGRWPRLSAQHLRSRLACLNISLTAPPELGEIFRVELLDSCSPAVAMSEPPCSGHRCEMGQCLHPTQVCNGVPDCDDGSDEVDCDFNITSCAVKDGQCQCAEDQIQCAESGSCWHYRAFCDGQAGCLSGADEPDVCTCRGFLWLAAPELICDQKVDCKTGDDEFDCQYEAGQFLCYRDATVRLIGRAQVCDGTYQCAGGEDEEHCLCLLERLPPLAPDHSGKLSFNVSESRLGAPRCDSAGYLLVRVRGRWVAVPQTMWNDDKSRRVCANLGYHQMSYSEMRPMHSGQKSAIYIACE